MRDGSLLQFEPKGPAVLWRNGLPLLESRALFVGQPIHELPASFCTGTEGLGDFFLCGLSGFADERVRSHRIILEKQTAVIRGRDGAVARGQKLFPRRQDPKQRCRWI